MEWDSREQTTKDYGPQAGYGRGYHRRFVPANLAANLVWEAVVPGGELWRFVSVLFQVTANATAGNRTFLIESLGQDSSVLWRLEWPDVVIASGTRDFCMLEGMEAVITGGSTTTTIPAPSMLMRAGETILFDLQGGSGADTTTGPFVEIMVYRDGPDGHETGRRPVHHISTDAVYLVASDSAQYLSTEQGVDRWHQNP